MADKTPWFVGNSPEIGKAFQAYLHACQDEGALDRKTKELLMAALACVFRCSHCTDEHIRNALQAGASKAEVTEALLIAALEGAGTQLSWAPEIFKTHLAGEAE